MANEIWTAHPGSQQIFQQCPVWECLLWGNRGGGKGLLPDEKVLTPNGWAKMKHLKKGYVISNPDGSSQSVVDVFHREKQQMYLLKFSDGTKIKCDGDHLWFAKIANRIKGKTIRYNPPLDFYGSIHRTEDLYKLLTAYPNRRPLIPCNDPIKYRQAWKTKVDAYLIGLLLGDGNISKEKTCVTSGDDEIIKYLQKEGASIYSYEGYAKEARFSFNSDISNKINELGLRGTYSHTKFIPERLMRGSIEERLAVLQGLMDSDGYAQEDGSCYYTSVSKKLAKNVRTLILSLGGWASISKSYPTYTYKGEKKIGKLAYELYIQFPNKVDLFRLERKKERVRNKNYMHGRLVRTVKSITKLKKKRKTICIIVNNPNRLFVTKEFLVTHNTDSLVMDYLSGVGRGYGVDYKGLLLREATTELGDVISKCKKWIPRIFPSAKYNGSKKIWTFEDGETLWLNYARVEDDYEQYHGHEYPWIGWEELTNHPFANIYLKLMSCNRSSNKHINLKYRATCNPSGPGHCVPYGEVLTPTGWVDIKTMKVGEAVFTIDNKGYLKETKVSQIHKSYYKGDMVNVNKRGLHIACTPNHSIPKIGGVVGNREKEFTLLPFNKLPGEVEILRSGKWKGLNKKHFVVDILKTRKRKLIQPTKILYSDYAELMGWFLSEGHTVERDKAFLISQCKKPQRENIKKLLDRCGFVYGTTKTGFLVHAPDWWNYFKQFGKCRAKFIPLSLKQSCYENLLLLFTSLMDGDGNWSKKGVSGAYYTTSKQLQSDFCEIAIKLGFIVKTAIEDIKNRKGLSYIIYVKTTSKKHSTIHTGNHRYNVKTSTKDIDVFYKKYEGLVYCIGVEDTHTFILRQKGSVWISGNSWVKARFIDKADACDIFVNEYGQERTHIQSSLDENKTLLDADPAYKAKLMGLTEGNKMLRDAWVHGSWDLIAGGFFTDVWDPKIHIIREFAVPRSWRLVRSFDWGSSKPWAVTYALISNGEQSGDNDIPYLPKGSVIIPNEIYGWTGEVNKGDEATSSEIAERVKNVDNALLIEYGIRCVPGPADTSIWDVKDGASIANSLGTLGCRWTRAYKGAGSRIAGWSLIRQMLYAAKTQNLETPHLYFMERAMNHIRTLPIMQRDKKKPEDIDTELEDHCFVHNTEVITDQGCKKIGDLVNKTGKILSVNGEFVNFKNCRLINSSKNLVKVTFNDGYSVVCTSDHNFLTTKGFVEAGKLLTLSNTYCIVSKIKGKEELCKNVKKELLFCQKQSKNLMEQFIINVENIFKQMENDYTDKFGNIIMGKYQKNSMSIIKRVEAKTILTIYNFFQNTNIYPSILKGTKGYLQKRLLKKLQNGIKEKKERSGIINIMKALKKICIKKLNVNVLFVGKLWKVYEEMGTYFVSPIVQTYLESNLELMMLKESVKYVPKHLQQTNIPKKEPVHVHADQNWLIGVKSAKILDYKKEPVFCLQAEGTHSFALANGVIVSNCMDSLRYLVARKLMSIKQKKVNN